MADTKRSQKRGNESQDVAAATVVTTAPAYPQPTAEQLASVATDPRVQAIIAESLARREARQLQAQNPVQARENLGSGERELPAWLFGSDEETHQPSILSRWSSAQLTEFNAKVGGSGTQPIPNTGRLYELGPDHKQNPSQGDVVSLGWTNASGLSSDKMLAVSYAEMHRILQGPDGLDQLGWTNHFQAQPAAWFTGQSSTGGFGRGLTIVLHDLEITDVTGTKHSLGSIRLFMSEPLAQALAYVHRPGEVAFRLVRGPILQGAMPQDRITSDWVKGAVIAIRSRGSVGGCQAAVGRSGLNLTLAGEYVYPAVGVATFLLKGQIFESTNPADGTLIKSFAPMLIDGKVVTNPTGLQAFRDYRAYMKTLRQEHPELQARFQNRQQAPQPAQAQVTVTPTAQPAVPALSSPESKPAMGADDDFDIPFAE